MAVERGDGARGEGWKWRPRAGERVRVGGRRCGEGSRERDFGRCEQAGAGAQWDDGASGECGMAWLARRLWGAFERGGGGAGSGTRQRSVLLFLRSIAGSFRDSDRRRSESA